MSHSYFVRITPSESLTIDDLVDTIEQLSINKYFVCLEEASRPHFHLCLWTDRSPENLRYQLKTHINGQVYISGKEIQDKVKAIAYCMKDGVYRQKSIDILTFITAAQVTRPKESFDKAIKEITESSITNDRSIPEIIEQIIDTHIKFNRKIYIQHIRALSELIRAKRCKSYKQILIDKIIGYD